MKAFEYLEQWLELNQVKASLLSFDQSVHSVEEAIAVSGYPLEQITKSIVMVDENNDMLMALVPAKFRASTERVRKFLSHSQRPRVATADEVAQALHQQVGGNHPFDLGEVRLLVDPLIFDQQWMVTGGGDDRHLLHIESEKLRQYTTFVEARVRK